MWAMSRGSFETKNLLLPPSRTSVEASRAGELLNQDTFYWGTLKGVGKVYVQVIVDIFCSLAFREDLQLEDAGDGARPPLRARAANSTTRSASPSLRSSPTNGREFRGREDSHPYELPLAIEAKTPELYASSKPPP